MGIYRRGQKYWARAQRSGREHRASLKTSSKAVAERRYREWLDELDAIEWGDKPRRRFAEAADRFVREHLSTLRITSARRYGVSLAWLADEFENKHLDQIGTAELAEFERKRRAAGASPPTVRRDLACLSSIFGSCIEWEWCDLNPVSPYMRRRKKRGLREAPARTRYLSHEEEAQLLAYASPPVQIAVAFAIDTGLRREEQIRADLGQSRPPGRRDPAGNRDQKREGAASATFAPGRTNSGTDAEAFSEPVCLLPSQRETPRPHE